MIQIFEKRPKNMEENKTSSSKKKLWKNQEMDQSATRTVLNQSTPMPNALTKSIKTFKKSNNFLN